jgi:hypothetical protein
VRNGRIALIARKGELEIPRDEGVCGCPASFGVAAREIHAAHRAESSVRTKSGTGDIVIRVEDVYAMLSRRQSVVDDQRQHDVAG